MTRSHGLIAGLRLVSGVTHVSQLAVYPATVDVLGAAFFGVLYFGIGLRLLRANSLDLWWGTVLPAIGGGLGLHRFFVTRANPFSLFHVAIDPWWSSRAVSSKSSARPTAAEPARVVDA